MSGESERTLKSLNDSNPNTSFLVAHVLLIAHDVLGYGKEMERAVANAVVNAFYESGITGAELNRLNEFTGGDAERVYDILTIPEELERFKASTPPESK